MNRRLLFRAIGSIATVIATVFLADEADRRTDRRVSKRLRSGSKTATQTAATGANRVRATSRTAALKAKGPLMTLLVSVTVLVLALAQTIGLVALVAGVVVAVLGAAGILKFRFDKTA